MSAIASVSATLWRVSQRLEARIGRAFELEKAVSELRVNFEGLGHDFAEFFPQLQAHVATICADKPSPDP